MSTEVVWIDEVNLFTDTYQMANILVQVANTKRRI